MWRNVLHFQIKTTELTASSSNSGPNSPVDQPRPGSLQYYGTGGDPTCLGYGIT
jgi:hypothetical protein